MFRENVLTRDDILDRIATTMIPVAVDRWIAEDPTTAEAKFLQPFLAKHPPEGSPCIYTPDGEVLGGFRGFGDMARRTSELIESALKRFGPVKPRRVEAMETHALRGRGVRSDGVVQLAEIIRPSRDSLRFLNTKTPVISSVTLSKLEFQTFHPPELAVGTRWTVPEKVARKFARVSSPLCAQHAPRPDWVTDVRLTGRVESVANGTAVLRYEGLIATRQRVSGETISEQKAEFSGDGRYNATAERLEELFLVGSGDLRWPEAPEKTVRFDLLVEWLWR